MAEKERVCPNCGTTFVSKYFQIYWSSKCKDVYNYRKHSPRLQSEGDELKCERCGKPLKGLQGRFCSVKCKREIYRQERMQEKPPRIKICAYCGEKFSTRSGVQKYCSRDCAASVIYAAAKERGYQTIETGEVVVKSIISLDEAARMARAAGKTYGEMFAPKVEIVFPWAVK